MENKHKKTFIINVLFFALAGLCIWLLSKLLFGFLMPFVIAFILAFAVQRPSNYLSEKLHIKKGICAAVSVVLIYLILITLISVIGWQLTVQIADFIEEIPTEIDKFSALADKWNLRLSGVFDLLPEELSDSARTAFDSAVSNILVKVTNFFSDFITGLAGKLPLYLFSIAVTVLASCYAAKDYDRLVLFVKGFIKKDTAARAVKIKNIIVENVLKILTGYLLLAVIAFFEIMIGLFILKVKYAPIFAALIAIVDFLPVLGSGTILLPWAAVAFLTSNFKLGIGLLILYGAVTVVRYFAEPRIISRQIGINPLFTLLLIFLGLRIGGIGGMILFPIGAIVIIDYYKQQLKEERDSAVQ